MSEENIENITKSASNFAPTFVDHHLLPGMKFNEHCLINNIPIPNKAISLFISYTLNQQLRHLNTDVTFCKCLFGSVKLTKNANLDKYKHSDYGIDLILVQNFYLQMETLEKMSLFLELI